jgi:phosphoenolpyruvate carboxykinase (diphosphate)
MVNLARDLGFHFNDGQGLAAQAQLIQYINLKLAAIGNPVWQGGTDRAFLDIARPLLTIHHEKNQRLSHALCAADQRIQDWLDKYLSDVAPSGAPRLPGNTFMLDRHGLARAMSLPADRDTFLSDHVSSYRLKQGVLHNPRKDRRTTAGVFHVAEGGLSIPDDKTAVPKGVFFKLLEAAVRPPEDLLLLPFTSSQTEKARLFVSLLLRPLVCPAVPGVISEKSLEIRFFAPGGLVSNLDFVESIFGNGGNPWLPENDAGLDVEHWTGHTGCVILAPHLTGLRKKDLGLPRWEGATDRQKRDGMCWKAEDELYNGGQAFKVAARDMDGVMVTIIADNYFGYCKKEVKTQISFSANLYGLAEEEHSGGAVAFPAYDLGEEFHLEGRLPQNGATFKDVSSAYGGVFMDVMPEGYAVDKNHPDVIYVPEDARFHLPRQSVTWGAGAEERRIKLLAGRTYVLPSGYKVRIKKQTGGTAWHLVGTSGEGTVCHKPCTVSGGGKSEISKSITDAMVQGPLFAADFVKDMDAVSAVVDRRFGEQFKDAAKNDDMASRPLLSERRSLGSVIKLLTPSPEYTDAYNDWLKTLPPYVKEIVFVVKRYYHPDWGKDWRRRFSVDLVNGLPGHELKLNNTKLVANYLRVGHDETGAWRIFKVRQDFCAAEKVQVEDDITASVVVPAARLANLNPAYKNPSVKFVQNCEYRLFQRPDDCVHRGYDKQAESDISGPSVFLSNFEPLDRAVACELVEDATGFDQWTEPVKRLLTDFLKENRASHVVSPAHPRLVNGKPSKNPRYLQDRPDLVNPRGRYLGEMGTRLFRRVPSDRPVLLPVNAVLAGRRNNPPDPQIGLPALAVYNPIHCQELPELFMDFICSITGKSPSTTGFGTEGALTKGPFNALWPVVDLNNALLSYILTGYDGFTSAAGYVGPKIQVDHDISLLVPEIWCRMSVAERETSFLIKEGCLEKIEDFMHDGRKVLASRLGLRITRKFVRSFLGRIFSNPDAVFTDEMLAPERQGLDVFVEGVDAIVEAQQRAARHYFADGSVDAACPPLKALLHIMAHGHWEGKDVHHPEVRRLFARETVLKSGWYEERLRVCQAREASLWRRHVAALEEVLSRPGSSSSLAALNLSDRLALARAELKRLQSPAALDSLTGTLGADPFTGQTALQEREPAAGKR